MTLKQYFENCENIKKNYPKLDDENLIIAVKKYNKKKTEWKKLLSREDLKEVERFEEKQIQKQS